MQDQDVQDQDRKSALRRSARDARRAMSDHARHEADVAVNARLRELPELRIVRAVLVYAAAGGEVDVEPTAAELRTRGITTLYPRVRGEDLDLVPVTDLSSLVAGHRNILEPRGEPADPTVVDAAIVPGVAFDLRGGRLGQGGGHYDRLLPRIGDAIRVAVAYTCQVVPQVPRDEHDVAMDILVTDRSVSRPGAPSRR